MDAAVLVIAALAVLIAIVATIGWRREKAQKRKIARVLHENLSERTPLRQAANVLDHMQIGVYVARLDDPRDERSLRLVAANPAASAVTGVRDSDALGRRPEEAFPALSHLDLSGTLAQVVRSGVQVTLENVRTRDTAYAVNAFPLPDQGVGLTIEDITDRTLAEQRARHQALHDGLTGLPNRMLLVDRLQQAIEAESRVAVVVLDIDRFKEVNATLGHHHGDLLLEQVARRLSIVVNDSTTVARVGSDEFAVVLSGVGDEASTLEAAERLTASLDRPISLDGVPVDTRCTAGIAIYPDHGDDADTLLKRAIMALIEAEPRGRAPGDVPAGARPVQPAPAHPHRRPARRDRAQRARAAVPAERASPRGSTAGRRSTAPLASPLDGSRRTRRIHRAGGGLGADPPAHPLGGRDGGGAVRALAPTRASTSTCR